MTEGLKQENKVIEYVENLIISKELVLYRSDPSNANLYDFKLVNSKKEYYFEIYSPENDFKQFYKKFQEKGVAAFNKDYFKWGVVNKYFKQFKGNSFKFLIVNINNDGDMGDFNLNYFKGKSELTSIFSCSVIPEGFNGLFHKNIINISNTYPPKIIGSLFTNCFKEMLGVISFFNNEFIELIINPFSNIVQEDIEFIKNLFCIKTIIQNEKELSGDERSITILKEDIYDNINFKLL